MLAGTQNPVSNLLSLPVAAAVAGVMCLRRKLAPTLCVIRKGIVAEQAAPIIWSKVELIDLRA